MGNTIKLNALDTFKCIGADCPVSCCTGVWADVDGPTLETWQSIPDSTEKNWFEVKLTDYPGRDELFIKRDNEDRCKFLDTDNLCHIQKQYDESYLPLTCTNFPRVTISNPQRNYQTALFSCPEIVRLVFTAEPDEKLFYKQERSEAAPNNLTQNDNLLLALDELVTSILLTEKFPIGIRVFYLSTLFIELLRENNKGTLSTQQVDKHNSAIKANLYEINIEFKQRRLQPHPAIAGSFWKVVFELLYSQEIDQRFLESEEGLLTSKIARCTDNLEDYRVIYETIKIYCEKSRHEIRNKLGPVMQKYLMNLFLSQGFPMAPTSGAHVFSLFRIVIGLCMLQLILWMKVQQEKSVDVKFLQEIVVELHRKFIQHNVIDSKLQEDSYMTQIDRYCTCFLDLY